MRPRAVDIENKFFDKQQPENPFYHVLGVLATDSSSIQHHFVKVFRVSKFCNHFVEFLFALNLVVSGGGFVAEVAAFGVDVSTTCCSCDNSNLISMMLV